MDTLTLIRNVRAIKSLITPEVESYFLSYLYWGPKSEIDLHSLLSAGVRFAHAAHRLEAMEEAQPILRAFGLEPILKDDYLITIQNAYIMRLSAADRRPAEPPELMQSAVDGWRLMVALDEPIARLTLPHAVNLLEPDEGVLTFFLRPSHGHMIDSPTLAGALRGVQALYDAFASIFGAEDAPTPQVLHLSGGPVLRVDLGGAPEVLRPLKTFVRDYWRCILPARGGRPREELPPAIETLEAFVRIRELERGRAIDATEGAQLRRRLVRHVEEFFQAGGTIREIEPREIINNIQLLESYQQKLLDPPSPPALPAVVAPRAVVVRSPAEVPAVARKKKKPARKIRIARKKKAPARKRA